MITTHQQRLELTLTVTVPRDQTPAEIVEWVHKYFQYYHPSMAPVVVAKHPKVIEDELSLLGEEPALVTPGEELL